MIGQNLVMVGFMAISFQSVAVDINYKDLKRPGRSHTKFYSISGLKSEGDSYINQFNNKDSYRVSKASSVASSSSSNYSSSSSSSSHEKSNTSYQCTYVCKGNSFEYEVSILAKNNNEAQRLSHSHAKKTCKHVGSNGVLSRWGSGSTLCR